MKFLDIQGVGVLWNSIKEKFLPLSGGTMTGDITLISLNRGLQGYGSNIWYVSSRDNVGASTSHTTMCIGIGKPNSSGAPLITQEVLFWVSTWAGRCGIFSSA